MLDIAGPAAADTTLPILIVCPVLAVTVSAKLAPNKNAHTSPFAGLAGNVKAIAAVETDPVFDPTVVEDP